MTLKRKVSPWSPVQTRPGVHTYSCNSVVRVGVLWAHFLLLHKKLIPALLWKPIVNDNAHEDDERRSWFFFIVFSFLFIFGSLITTGSSARIIPVEFCYCTVRLRRGSPIFSVPSQRRFRDTIPCFFRFAARKLRRYVYCCNDQSTNTYGLLDGIASTSSAETTLVLHLYSYIRSYAPT